MGPGLRRPAMLAEAPDNGARLDSLLSGPRQRHHDGRPNVHKLGSRGCTGTTKLGLSVPPSISNTFPVTQEEASETRYRTAQAMSSGSPGRRIGRPAMN